MSFLKGLFGKGASGKDAPTAKPEEHNGFRIFVAPIKESQGYRVSARIEKDFGAETKTHQLVRADVISSENEARKLTLLKAKQVIDQLGDQLF